MASEPLSPPKVQVRGRSFTALIVAPAAPLKVWFAALDEHLGRAAALFANRPIVADLSAALEPGERPECLLLALDRLAARNLRVIGVEGVDPGLLAGTRWARLPTILHTRRESAADESDPMDTSPVANPARAAPSLMIDRPVRSGQSIYFEAGDVTVVGSVASGAEVIAGGSIHIYGTLRGRAIAGSRDARARIFCRKLEAELLSIDGLYMVADDMPAHLRGQPIQVWLDGDSMMMTQD